MSPFPGPGTRVVIYARYSTDMQRFKSIEDQVSLCREYAARHGWVVVDVYYDAERSGTTMVGRDGFYRLLAAADRGEFCVLLTEDLDRVSRTASDTHGIVEELEYLDISICSVISGMVSDLEVAFKAVQNAQYIKQLAQKTRRGQEGVVRSGRISGSLAYGYRKVFSPEGINGLREIHPEQAATIERIYQDYVAGVSPLEICRALNAKGVPGPRGKQWQCGGLIGNKTMGGGVLRNRLYIGEFHWGRTAQKRNRKNGKVKVRATALTEQIHIKIPHLRILDDELFYAAQNSLEERGSEYFGEHRYVDYLFSGKIVCGLCGSSCVVLSKRLGCTGRARKGICTNSRRAPREDFEQAVLEGLKDRLLVPDLIEPYLAEYRAEIERAIAEQQERTESSQTRMKDLERRKGNIIAQLGDGQAQGLAGQVLVQELERLEEERLRFERETRRRPRAMPEALDTPSIVERLREQVEGLRVALEGEERDAVRARNLIRGLVTRIVMTPIPVEKEDGRGAGPVCLTVEGSLSQLLDLADVQIGRVILQGSGTGTMQGDSTLTFRFYVDIAYENPRLLCGVYPDLPILARLLDDADAPVRISDLVLALADGKGPFLHKAVAGLNFRVRKALAYLETRGQVRAIQLGRHSGWVWTHVALTDEEWKERASRPKPEGHPLPVFRVSPPEATVVVIGRSQGEGP